MNPTPMMKAVMSEHQIILGVIALVITVSANTALFIWRLVTVRDTIVAEFKSEMHLQKTKFDLEVDMLNKSLTDHRLEVAEKYLRRESFRDSMNKLEASTSNALSKVEMSLSKLADRVEKISERSV